MNSSVATGLSIPEFIYASNAIIRHVRFAYLGVDIEHIPPLAQGYGFIPSFDSSWSEDLYFQLLALLRNHKTVVLPHIDSRFFPLFAQLLADLPGIRLVHVARGVPCEISANDLSTIHADDLAIVFLLTDQFLLRRFLHQRIQQHNIIFQGQKKLPIQTVRFVGLGPTAELLTERATLLIRDSSHIVLFDRTLENILHNTHFYGRTYVLPYVYEDFALNLLALNLMLASLQATGISDVTVLIEGNPEIYDFAEGLSTVGRQFLYEVSMPLVVMSCQWLEKLYNLDLLNQGYILTSGFNTRQGITTAELLHELDDFLKTALTCIVMEMYCGDIPLVVAQIRKARRKKLLLVLTNMFSPRQQVYFLPFDQFHRIDLIERIKGKFTTLVIVDEQCLPPDSLAYDYLIATAGLHTQFMKNTT